MIAFGNSSVLAATHETRTKHRDYLELPASNEFSTVPYVWERNAGGKHIVVIGTRHVGNPRSPMYDQIEAIFKRVRPQLVLHESVAPDDLATEPRDQAIRRAADMGFTVYLAKRYGVPAQSGDAP